ncbi:TPA: phage tail protein [Klebsiella pneumoniae]|jgi:phage-related tail fiber protein|nr:phage tail protein [Klebsiella pneumoniae]HBR3765172.1 phage tail protein [Klebsiella pneumoniae]HBT0122478.1 phage tail protein [Klebsiella pneumoniae]HBT0150101.1 phage tail protein [Klebsiella pneumoniae]HBT0528210.1 phage tail protein [Klebsiella pneumoniae]
MSNSKYSAILTAAGVAAMTHAALTGELAGFTHMAVGDGGGTLPVPVPESTGLVNELYRAPLNRLEIADEQAGVIKAEMILPAQVGGFWQRELALFDTEGVCLAVANMPESYKPLLSQGAGRNQILTIWIAVSNTADVKLINNPETVVATVAEVEKARAESLDYTDEMADDLTTTLKQAIADAIVEARRDFWEEENPIGTVRFFATKANPNTLYPWSTWVYTGENKSIRIAKADGSNVGQTGGSDTASIARANLPAVQVSVSGTAASVDMGEVQTKDAGAAGFNVYRFGADGRENTRGKFSIDDVEMGDIPVPVSISAHKHAVVLPPHGHTVSGKTDNLGDGAALNIVEAHTLLMCWARTE